MNFLCKWIVYEIIDMYSKKKLFCWKKSLTKLTSTKIYLFSIIFYHFYHFLSFSIISIILKWLEHLKLFCIWLPGQIKQRKRSCISLLIACKFEHRLSLLYAVYLRMILCLCNWKNSQIWLWKTAPDRLNLFVIAKEY